MSTQNSALIAVVAAAALSGASCVFGQFGGLQMLGTIAAPSQTAVGPQGGVVLRQSPDVAYNGTSGPVLASESYYPQAQLQHYSQAPTYPGVPSSLPFYGNNFLIGLFGGSDHEQYVTECQRRQQERHYQDQQRRQQEQLRQQMLESLLRAEPIR